MSAPKIDLDSLLEMFAAKLAPMVAAQLRTTQSASEFYTQHDAPIAKRAFLEAARRGDFESSKRGKTVLAKRADVDAWIAAGARARAAADRGSVSRLLAATAGMSGLARR